MRAHVLACVLGLFGYAATAQAADALPLPDADACLPGIVAAEHQFGLPPKLLQTIGLVESGRADPATGHVAPWPWTINAAGVDHVFATKEAAVQAVRDLQQAGTRSIDVGCMQINLLHHPNAFASLDEAFDPGANIEYGARFLRALYHETGNWPQAAAAYHSRTQEIGAAYETRVMAVWPLAGRFPDPTLHQHAQPAAPEEDLSRYTPAFAARVKQMHADEARLAPLSAPIARPPRQQSRPSEPDYSRYTPEFAARLREMDRFRAAHAAPVAGSDGDGAHRGGIRVRLADGR